MSESHLIISDLHAPVYHKDTIDFLSEIKRKFRPDHVKCTGDEINWEKLSYHEHNPDLPGAKDELTLARRALIPIFKLFPECDVMESNHSSLPFRKAMTLGLPTDLIKPYKDILIAPSGWRWHLTHTFMTKLGPVFMVHGKSSSPMVLSKSVGMNAIQGHYHSKAYLSYWSSPVGLFYDMNVGALCDDNSLAMRYMWRNVFTSIMSVGLLQNGVPRLLPMIVNKQNRWIGEV